jgi:serine/threonine protein kinase
MRSSLVPYLTPNQVIPFTYCSSTDQGSQEAFVEPIEIIGKGGMGEVWSANIIQSSEDGHSISYPNLDQAVIKVFKPTDVTEKTLPSLLERFEKERVAHLLLLNPGIIRLLGNGLIAPENRPFNVLERGGRSCKSVISIFCQKQNRLKWISFGGQMMTSHYWLGDNSAPRLSQPLINEPFTRAYGRAIAKALGFAHGNGIIHRDMKPANTLLQVENVGGLMMPVEGTVKITDFGVTHIIGYEGEHTQVGSIVGSFYCMPLEQLKGKRNVNASADTFALGVILNELVTGLRLYPQHLEGINSYTYIEECKDFLGGLSCIDPGDYVDGLSKEFREFIKIATSRDQDNRFPDGMAMFEALCALPPLTTEHSVGNADTLFPISLDSDSMPPDSDRPPPPSERARDSDDFPTPAPQFQSVVAHLEDAKNRQEEIPRPAKLPSGTNPDSRLKSFFSGPIVMLSVMAIIAGIAVTLLISRMIETSPAKRVAQTVQPSTAHGADVSKASKPSASANLVTLDRNSAYQYALGLLKSHQSWTDAEHQLKRALELTPDAPEIYSKLALMSLKLSRRGEAKAFIAEALKRNPTSEVYYELAKVSNDLGESQQAKAYRDKAMQLEQERKK